jgi:NADH dehydrogenase [ubiquinone] 1 alpha subcomplex assembly factor 7
MSLAKHLRDSIRVAGPLSVSQFIRASLLHPLGGYYMKQDVFGTRGDFVTGPEISQLLGELLGVWFASLGAKKFNFVELGPGRGTLMRDLLVTIDQFPTLRDRVKGVHLVEASPFLKQMQANLLAPGKDKLSVPLYTAEGFISD